MGLFRRIVDRPRSWIADLFESWSEADVSRSGCCTPEHLLPEEGASADHRPGDRGEYRDGGR